MAALDLEEQEQISALKAWWTDNGKWLVTLVVVAAVGYLGYEFWNGQKREQNAKAGAVFSSLEEAIAAKDAKKAKDIAGELISKYPGTSYATLGALLAAKSQVEAGELKNARSELEWVAQHAPTPELKDIARLRLAYVMIDENAFAEAEKQLSAKPVASLEARYAEARGDLLMLQNKMAEARAAYKDSLAKFDEQAKLLGVAAAGAGNPYRDTVEIKLDAVGGAQ